MMWSRSIGTLSRAAMSADSFAEPWYIASVYQVPGSST